MPLLGRCGVYRRNPVINEENVGRNVYKFPHIVREYLGSGVGAILYIRLGSPSCKIRILARVLQSDDFSGFAGPRCIRHLPGLTRAADGDVVLIGGRIQDAALGIHGIVSGEPPALVNEESVYILV